MALKDLIRRLRLPRTREALGKEILDYEIEVSEDANDRYGALFKVGTHDDLVMALGLAVQEYRGGGQAPAVLDAQSAMAQ